ncbi:MAG: YifB family Mg chelatase-like AAA ATPase [Candidatus Paceibacterota bacterium]|nr:MAG: YifB family Mg chelatase-like AAA ATPase [Candidatus Paceibacterota bacterium]
MPTRIRSAGIVGIEASPIDVEVDAVPGIHSFLLVGLPDKAVQESKDRISAAVRNSSFAPPSAKHKRITISLAPADLRKEGPAFDLPIALGYLAETKQIQGDWSNTLFAGELGLDGSLRPIRGALPLALCARAEGAQEVVLPVENARECAWIEGISIVGARSLGEVVAHIMQTVRLTKCTATIRDEVDVHDPFEHIVGQDSAKRALVVAAAGGHNVLMFGAPGSGKTLLARALASLLPPLEHQEMLDVARIYSAAGLLSGDAVPRRRPFRNPHHTASATAIIGGGAIPRPGEISLAHRGVLFLDELPEFPRSVLESLRQPLEDGVVTIARASGSATLPAQCMLVAAMNPCPCGNAGDPELECVCSGAHIARYAKKVSGPLLDRLDIQVRVPREVRASFKKDVAPNAVINMRARVALAWQMQKERNAHFGILRNSDIRHGFIHDVCALSDGAERLLESSARAFKLSMRSIHRIQKIARTVADLDGKACVEEGHVAEAVQLRTSDMVSAT